MKPFWQLFRDSVIMQSFMVAAIVATVCYLAIVGRPIPEVVVNMAMLIAGWFFGAKTAVASQTGTRETIEALTGYRQLQVPCPPDQLQTPDPSEPVE